MLSAGSHASPKAKTKQQPLLSKFQGFVHGSESRIARLAHQSTGNWIGQLHATRSKPLVRDHSDTRHGIVMPRVAAEHKSEAL